MASPLTASHGATRHRAVAVTASVYHQAAPAMDEAPPPGATIWPYGGEERMAVRGLTAAVTEGDELVVRLTGKRIKRDGTVSHVEASVIVGLDELPDDLRTLALDALRDHIKAEQAKLSHASRLLASYADAPKGTTT